jgi:hypothetical protein
MQSVLTCFKVKTHHSNGENDETHKNTVRIAGSRAQIGRSTSGIQV